jgi:hypothetical protein
MSDGTNVYKAGGSYLPLSGGTLTGGLTGTSYTFTGNGSVGGTFYPGNTAQNIASDSTTLYLRGTTIAFQDAAATTTRASVSSGGVFSTSQFIGSTPGSGGQYAAVSGSTGAFFRNDGTSYYLLGNSASTTAYDNYRPITVALSSGALCLDCGTPKGGTTVGGIFQVNGAATFSGGITGTLSGNASTATTATNVSGGSVSATTGTFSGALSGASVAGTMIANNATTLAGVSTSALVTPAGLVNQSVGTNGYYKLPGGLIEEWGQVASVSSTGTAVTWPLACPTSVLSVIVTPVYGGTPTQAQVFNVTLSGATLYIGVSGNPVNYRVLCN